MYAQQGSLQVFDYKKINKKTSKMQKKHQFEKTNLLESPVPIALSKFQA